MKRSRSLPLWLCAVPALFMPGGVSAGPDGAAALVEKLPADGVPAGQEVLDAILKLGPAGVREVVGMVLPPSKGGDAKARFALNGLAFYVTRPGAERQRRVLAAALIEGLENADDPDLKTFFLNQLQLVGKDEAVAPLAELLGDDKLCDPATQALTRIGTPAAVSALVAALPASKGANLVTLIRALGDLQAKGAVVAILPHAMSTEADLRRVSLFALSNIGDPAAAEVLKKAAESTSPYDRAQATGLYLKFARNLSRSGAREQCAEICRELMRTRTDPSETHVVIDALTILVDCLGTNGMGAVMRAIDSPHKDIREAALKLTRDFPNRLVTVKLLAKLRSAPTDTKLSVMSELARRGDRLAKQPLLGLLRDDDKAIRLAAVAPAMTLAPEDAVPTVVAWLGQTADEEEADALTEALKRARTEHLALVPAVEGKAQFSGSAFAGLKRLGGLPALKALSHLLADPSLRARAASIIAEIAIPAEGQPLSLFGTEVTEVVHKAARAAEDTALKDRLYLHLRELQEPEEGDPNNLAQGKPVKTSVDQQGDHSPDKAVDGNAGDPNSAWFGASWPSWLRVDLGKPAKIDRAEVFFYWDGTRYYQYTVDVSMDDKTWKTVADASKNITPSTNLGVTHKFDPVEARFVRVNILKNSVNEAVHLVELRVYGEGTGPDAPQADAGTKPGSDGFVALYNGKDLAGWTGSVDGYLPEDDVLVCLQKGGGLLHTVKQYANFHLKFEYRLEPGGNNGIGIRFLGGGPSQSGMEIQILDDYAEKYAKLQPYQYHGSIYGVVPAKRGHTKKAGEWNTEEIIADGRRVKVIVNGVTIVDADIDKASEGGTMDHKDHPGLKNTQGFIGFCGHAARVEFRNIRIKEL